MQPRGLSGCHLEWQGGMLDAMVVFPPVPAETQEFLPGKGTLRVTAHDLPTNQTQLSRNSASRCFEAKPCTS